MTIATLPISARGRFTAGFSISSETAAIFTNPRKDTKTRAVVEKIGDVPSGKKGVKFGGSRWKSPPIAKTARIAISTRTT